MSDLELDPVSHDIVFADGQVSKIDGEAELRQALKIAFRTHLDEYAFDTAAGVGYRLIAVRPADESKVQAEILRVASERDGVESVEEIRIDTDPLTRLSTIDVTVRSIYGLVTLTV